MKGLKISDNLVTIAGLGLIALVILVCFRPEAVEEQPFTPINYYVVECNVAGTDQRDYVIEISTRDPEEVGRIIRLLEGGE